MTEPASQNTRPVDLACRNHWLAQSYGNLECYLVVFGNSVPVREFTYRGSGPGPGTSCRCVGKQRRTSVDKAPSCIPWAIRPTHSRWCTGPLLVRSAFCANLERAFPVSTSAGETLPLSEPPALLAW